MCEKSGVGEARSTCDAPDPQGPPWEGIEGHAQGPVKARRGFLLTGNPQEERGE